MAKCLLTTKCKYISLSPYMREDKIPKDASSPVARKLERLGDHGLSNEMGLPGS